MRLTTAVPCRLVSFSPRFAITWRSTASLVEPCSFHQTPCKPRQVPTASDFAPEPPVLQVQNRSHGPHAMRVLIVLDDAFTQCLRRHFGELIGKTRSMAQHLGCLPASAPPSAPVSDTGAQNNLQKHASCTPLHAQSNRQRLLNPLFRTELAICLQVKQPTCPSSQTIQDH